MVFSKDKCKSITRKEGSGRFSIVVKRIIDEQMEHNDGRELVKLLADKGYNLSLSTVLRCRSDLGWTWRGSAYT